MPGNLARYMFLKAAKAKDIDPTEEFLRMQRIYILINVLKVLSLALAKQLKEMQI